MIQKQLGHSLIKLGISIILLLSGHVLWAQQKNEASVLNTAYTSWGITHATSSINLQNTLNNLGSGKKDVIVAVIDTGIDPVHPFLSSNLFIQNAKADSKKFGVDFSKDHKEKFQPLDEHGHGTHVAGIIKSVFPNVKILTLKYFNPKASGKDNLNSTIEALRYAVDSNVDIINYSGGGPEPALEELRILKMAEKKGILIVAASGNEESDIDIKKNAYYPASYGLSNIITVSAYNQDLKIIPSSNWGKRSVDLFAPGERIKSSLNHGRSGYLTGTSQATAFVTGVAAIIKSQYPDASAAQLKSFILKSTKKEIAFLGKSQTEGRLDAYAALSMAKQHYTTESQRHLAAEADQKKNQGKIQYRINP